MRLDPALVAAGLVTTAAIAALYRIFRRGRAGGRKPSLVDLAYLLFIGAPAAS